MTVVSVREYARLTTSICANSLDRHQVSPSAFDWLCELQGRLSPGGAKLLEVDGRQWLHLNSLVGVIQTPCGTTLEILPKTYSDKADVNASRQLLRKMVLALLDLPAKEANEAALARFAMPLTEWVMARFIEQLQQLVSQGLRSDYVRFEEELPFLRGQLNTTAQMRQPLTHAHLFHIRHDVLVPNRPENRLLRLALERVRKSTTEPETWRIANELTHRMMEIPPSNNEVQNWYAWSDSRLMAHYQPIRPWCELVLGQSMPLALMGDTQGLSLLFPMEKLFESYVARWLRKQLPSGYHLQAQPRRHYLSLHDNKNMFRLEPDLLIHRQSDQTAWVLDTKWKRLNSEEKARNYGISQADMYQMLAYGNTYLQGKGSLYLIYPSWEKFQFALPPFHLPGQIQLEVIPFDIENEKFCIGEGEAVFL